MNELNLENLKIFALDGQHRVIGIRGIKELLDFGQIAYKDKLGNAKKDEFEKREYLIEKLDTRSSAFSKILDETISIEFIPAILQGETRDQARIRLRNYFVDINKNAKKIQKGDERQNQEYQSIMTQGPIMRCTQQQRTKEEGEKSQRLKSVKWNHA